MGAPVSGGVADGLSVDLRDLALSLVLHLPDDLGARSSLATGSALCTSSAATFRLVQVEDLGTICELRCAQSAEYAGLPLSVDDCRLFRLETEAYLRRNLNSRVFFALVERDGEPVSVSGLEVADRLPALDASGSSERAATVVGCYTPPAHRGQGYMRQMLSAWTAMAPLIDIDTLYLESRNAAMQHLAHDAGYEPASAKYRLRLQVCAPSADESLALAAAC